MNDTFKSILAIIAGILTGAVLSIITDLILEKTGVFPGAANPELYLAWMLALALLYRCIYTVASGFVTAKLAPNNSMRHVIILGSIGVVVTILGSIANWDKTSAGNAWYPILLILLTLPCTWLGGKLEGGK